MSKVLENYYSTAILEQACSLFALNVETMKLIRSNSNLIFDGGDKILRMSHSTIRSFEDILVEIDWVLFLKSQNLPVVKIVPSQQGRPLEQIIQAEHHFTIVCFEKIDGHKVSKEEWNTDHFFRLGKLTGQLHRVGQLYSEKPNLKYRHWDEIVEHQSFQYLPDDERMLKKLYEKLTTKFRSYPKNKRNYGLVHYDIHHGNYLLVDGPEPLILFDFEMICRSWFVQDVAIVLYYVLHRCSEEKLAQFEVAFMEQFWKGYETEYTIEITERKYIPKFLLYRDLLIYGFLCNIWKGKRLTDQDKNYQQKIINAIQRRRNQLGL